jgi:RecA/RadA recombinase
MDRHDNFAFSTAATAPRQEVGPEMSDRDREALHRMFSDMRRALAGSSHHRIASVPHP